MKRTFRDTKFLHQQPVIGRGGKTVTLTKLRTMKPGAHARVGEVFGDPADLTVIKRDQIEDPRVTRFGRLLRRTHLDELPQALKIGREFRPVGIRPRPHEIYRAMPPDIRKIYNEMGPGFVPLTFAAKRQPRTKEELWGLYREFYRDWKRDHVAAYLKWGIRGFLNRISGRVKTK